MTDKNDATKASPEVAKEQRADGSWPKPGDEGYVHPDGTEQSRRQLAENRQAAADRAAAGSVVHGAPMATPGPQATEQAEAAVKRAEDYSGETKADADKALTEHVANKLNEAQADADQRTAAADTKGDTKGKTTR